MLRWGILSTANIGQELVIPAIQDADNSVVTAIASRDLSRAAAVAARFGIMHAYESYDEILQSKDIDAVYIPLPTAQHVEWTIKAANAGKHVLSEKPIALKAEDIDQLIEARDRNHVLVSEGFMVCYSPIWLKVRGLIEAGAIGRLRQVQGAFTYYNRDPANMRNQLSLGGGALPDIGVYPTVTTRMSTGMEPKRVMARIERDKVFGTDIYASVHADFGSFELCFYVSTQLAARQMMVFHGDEGFIEVKSPFNANRYGPEELELFNRTHSKSVVFRFQDNRQYRLEIETFAKAVLGDTNALKAVFSLEQSRANQKMIDAIYRASETGTWETV